MTTDAIRYRNPLRPLAWPNRRNRRARRIAVDQLAQHFPDWHAKRFDAYFVHRIHPEWIAARDVEAIAREWTRQFFYHDERQRERDVRQVKVVAETYLVLLAAAESKLGPGANGSGTKPRTVPIP